MNEPEGAGPREAESKRPDEGVRVSRLAIASLICGILFIIPPAAVLAIVLGGIALSRIAASGGRLAGRGLAIAGICLGLLFFVAACVMAAFFPDFLRMPPPEAESAAAAACRQNLEKIAVAIDEYREENTGRFPPDFKTLLDAGLIDDPSILLCPSQTRLGTDPSFAGTDTSYNYARPVDALTGEPLPEDMPIVWDSRDRHQPQMVNVVYADGRIEQNSFSQLKDLVVKYADRYFGAPDLPAESDEEI